MTELANVRHWSSPMMARRADSLVFASRRIRSSALLRSSRSPKRSAIQMLVLARHGAELGAAGRRQADDHARAGRSAKRSAVEMAGGDEPVDEAGEVAVRHHHPLREIGQRHAVRRLVELRHQVEAGQRDVEALAQAAAHLALDQRRAGEKTQPEAQLLPVILRALDRLGLGVEREWRCSSMFRFPLRPPRWPAPSRSARPRRTARARHRRPPTGR